MLLYLATNTRPDVAANICILSQKVSSPCLRIKTEVFRVIRYLKGTKHFKLRLSSKDSDENFVAYSDANWAEDRKSNSGWFCGLLV